MFEKGSTCKIGSGDLVHSVSRTFLSTMSNASAICTKIKKFLKRNKDDKKEDARTF
jgi:hypothetical protein